MCVLRGSVVSSNWSSASLMLGSLVDRDFGRWWHRNQRILQCQRQINKPWLINVHDILLHTHTYILYLWCSLIHLFCFVWNKSWGHHFRSSPKRSDWRRRLHAGKCRCGTGEAEFQMRVDTVDVPVLNQLINQSGKPKWSKMNRLFFDLSAFAKQFQA